MIKPESKVMFRENYNGYFRDLKGKELTVMQTFPANKATLESAKLTVVEIEEIHLLNFDSVQEIYEHVETSSEESVSKS